MDARGFSVVTRMTYAMVPIGAAGRPRFATRSRGARRRHSAITTAAQRAGVRCRRSRRRRRNLRLALPQCCMSDAIATSLRTLVRRMWWWRAIPMSNPCGDGCTRACGRHTR